MKRISTILIIALTALLSSSVSIVAQMANSKKDSSEINIKKFKEGIDFFAIGNEPFWNMDMSMNQFLRFNTLDGMKVNLGSVKGEKAMDANVTRYVSQSDLGMFTMTISQNECTDNMSGEKFDYKVIVEINNEGDKNYKRFEGCGRYVPNYNLNRTWILKSIRNNEIPVSDKFKKLPELRIDVGEMKFSGNAGCNSFFGSLFAEHDLIRFSNPASTMMMCENMETEQKFFDALSKTVYYKISGNQLFLSNPDSSLMVFYDPDAELKERTDIGEPNQTSELNGAWILENLNGKTIEQPNGRAKIPQIKIDVNELKYSGNGGCNNIFGNITVDGNTISFGPAAATRMACENSIESEFLTALKNISEWKIENNRLNLLQNGNAIVIFKKTD